MTITWDAFTVSPTGCATLNYEATVPSAITAAADVTQVDDARTLKISTTNTSLAGTYTVTVKAKWNNLTTMDTAG